MEEFGYLGSAPTALTPPNLRWVEFWSYVVDLLDVQGSGKSTSVIRLRRLNYSSEADGIEVSSVIKVKMIIQVRGVESDLRKNNLALQYSWKRILSPEWLDNIFIIPQSQLPQ